MLTVKLQTCCVRTVAAKKDRASTTASGPSPWHHRSQKIAPKLQSRFTMNSGLTTRLAAKWKILQHERWGEARDFALAKANYVAVPFIQTTMGSSRSLPSSIAESLGSNAGTMRACQNETTFVPIYGYRNDWVRPHWTSRRQLVNEGAFEAPEQARSTGSLCLVMKHFAIAPEQLQSNYKTTCFVL